MPSGLEGMEVPRGGCVEPSPRRVFRVDPEPRADAGRSAVGPRFRRVRQDRRETPGGRWRVVSRGQNVKHPRKAAVCPHRRWGSAHQE
jgi:hypothetical protein